MTAEKVICIGGGDTSIDVVSVARRLGKIERINERIEPEGDRRLRRMTHMVAARQGAQVTLTALFERSSMTATEEEVDDALTEGVTILNGVMPVALIRDASGRATPRLAKVRNRESIPTALEDTEFEVEADLIVSAIGQAGRISPASRDGA